MKITKVISHVLQYDLPEELGYSQQYYAKRTAHLVEVQTDEGVTGWGECFGPGTVALANKTIVEKVIQPLILGDDPMDRDVIWHKVYNLLRDHGQKGMPMQSLSGVDIATKMKVGLGPKDDVKLAAAVAEGIGDRGKFMVDANHCYTTSDAFYVGRALDELDAYWFEEPVAPEDHDGYRELRAGLRVNISGGEAEFNRWGWRQILENRGLDIAQPEVCAVGGISEYLRILTLCHAHFTPVINHVWGSAIAVATNLQLLAAMPVLPGGLHPWEPMLEFDTTDNKFRDELLQTPLGIQEQVKTQNGYVCVPDVPGIGVEPDLAFIRHYEIKE